MNEQYNTAVFRGILACIVMKLARVAGLRYCNFLEGSQMKISNHLETYLMLEHCKIPPRDSVCHLLS